MDRVRRAIENLGKREMPASPAKEGGHGDHWGCVLRAAEQEDLPAFLGKVVNEAERTEMFEAAGAGMAAHALGERLGACVLVVNNKLVTAYPEAQGGEVWPVTLKELVPWANGIEGQITGECRGAPVSFFDTRFYANRRKYKIGETYDFHISAFAYTLGHAPDTEMELESLGAKVSLRGAHAYMPANLDNRSADIDDYWFHSPLEAESLSAELAGRRLMVYPVILAIPEDFEMKTTLYAASHALAPDMAEARSGEDLEGFLWLQGRLCRRET